MLDYEIIWIWSAEIYVKLWFYCPSAWELPLDCSQKQDKIIHSEKTTIHPKKAPINAKSISGMTNTKIDVACSHQHWVSLGNYKYIFNASGIRFIYLHFSMNGNYYTKGMSSPFSRWRHANWFSTIAYEVHFPTSFSYK